MTGSEDITDDNLLNNEMALENQKLCKVLAENERLKEELSNSKTLHDKLVSCIVGKIHITYHTLTM